MCVFAEILKDKKHFLSATNIFISYAMFDESKCSSVNFAISFLFCLGWLEPLLDRIARNSTTVVCPVIDVIDDTTMEYHWRDSGGVNVGGFDWNLQFNWHAVPERERKRHKVTFCFISNTLILPSNCFRLM